MRIGRERWSAMQLTSQLFAAADDGILLCLESFLGKHPYFEEATVDMGVAIIAIARGCICKSACFWLADQKPC